MTRDIGGTGVWPVCGYDRQDACPTENKTAFARTRRALKVVSIMWESYEAQHKWLDEKFNHINTILGNIQKSMAELKGIHAACVSRCNTEMDKVYDRLRNVEHKQAAKNGAEEREKQNRQSENLTWQMIIALGTALSAVGAFIGYFIGRG